MSTNHFQISPTLPTEVEDILSLTRQLPVFNAEEITTVEELLQEHFGKGPEISGYYFLSCRAESRVVGFACYGPRPLTHGTFDLYWVATDPAMQRSGVGGLLTRRVSEEIKKLGGRLIIAETSGRADYLPARRFYENHDYQHAATITDFYALGDDLVIYAQYLT
jgi:D-alanine-D-alanine ligase